MNKFYSDLKPLASASFLSSFLPLLGHLINNIPEHNIYTPS